MNRPVPNIRTAQNMAHSRSVADRRTFHWPHRTSAALFAFLLLLDGDILLPVEAAGGVRTTTAHRRQVTEIVHLHQCIGIIQNKVRSRSSARVPTERNHPRTWDIERYQRGTRTPTPRWPPCRRFGTGEKGIASQPKPRQQLVLSPVPVDPGERELEPTGSAEAKTSQRSSFLRSDSHQRRSAAL